MKHSWPLVMKQKSWIMGLSLFLACTNCFQTVGQVSMNVQKNKKNLINNNYLESYADLLTLRAYGISKYNSFTINDEPSGTSIEYKPNAKFNIGFGFNYKWIGLNFAFNFPFINDDNEKYGETKRFDAQLNSYGRKIGFDIWLQSYDGYYIDKPQSFIKDWNDSLPYPIRQDVRTVSLGAKGYYVFKHKKFSYRASFIQNEWQKKSAGSFLVGGFFSLYAIQGDSSLVPHALKDTFSLASNIVLANMYNFGIAGGYAHTFVLKQHFFLTLSLVPGISFQSIRTIAENTDYNNKMNAPGVLLQFRGAVGYNSERLFGGLSFVNDDFALQTSESASLTYRLGNFRLFTGYRFVVAKKNKKKK